MLRKRHTAEEIIGKLREVEARIAALTGLQDAGLPLTHEERGQLQYL